MQRIEGVKSVFGDCARHSALPHTLDYPAPQGSMHSGL